MGVFSGEERLQGGGDGDAGEDADGVVPEIRQRFVGHGEVKREDESLATRPPMKTGWRR